MNHEPWSRGEWVLFEWGNMTINETREYKNLTSILKSKDQQIVSSILPSMEERFCEFHDVNPLEYFRIKDLYALTTREIVSHIQKHGHLPGGNGELCKSRSGLTELSEEFGLSKENVRQIQLKYNFTVRQTRLYLMNKMPSPKNGLCRKDNLQKGGRA